MRPAAAAARARALAPHSAHRARWGRSCHAIGRRRCGCNNRCAIQLNTRCRNIAVALGNGVRALGFGAAAVAAEVLSLSPSSLLLSLLASAAGCAVGLPVPKRPRASDARLRRFTALGCRSSSPELPIDNRKSAILGAELENSPAAGRHAFPLAPWSAVQPSIIEGVRLQVRHRFVLNRPQQGHKVRLLERGLALPQPPYLRVAGACSPQASSRRLSTLPCAHARAPRPCKSILHAVISCGAPAPTNPIT